MFHTLKNLGKIVTRAAQRRKVLEITGRHKMYNVEDVLSTKEIDVYKRLFKRMDTNNDGLLTKEDLRKGLKDFVNYTATEEELNETMQTLDSNNSGSIEFEEFIGYIAWSRKMRVEESIKYAFETFDKNQDGLINKEELREALVSLGIIPNESLLNNIMLISDEDNDGNITITQFKDIFYNKTVLNNTVLDDQK